MKEINIFIASSSSLHEERLEIEKFLNRKNDFLIKSNIYLKTVLWEKQSLRFDKARKQDGFNSLVKESDVFICLIYDKVGQFTLEEFEIAYQGFILKSNPKYLFIYFKDKPIKISEIQDFDSIKALKKSIKSKEQIWGIYENTPELLLKINNEISNIIEEHRDTNLLIDNNAYKVEFTHVTIDFIDDFGKKAKLTKFQIIRALKPFQFLKDAISVDGQIDYSSIKVDVGVSNKLNHEINWTDIITDLGYTVEKDALITKKLQCEIINSFNQKKEVWEHDNIGNVGLVKTTVIFPSKRKYKSHFSKILRGFNEIDIKPAREIIQDGRYALDLEIENEEKFDRIRLYWIW